MINCFLLQLLFNQRTCDMCGVVNPWTSHNHGNTHAIFNDVLNRIINVKYTHSFRVCHFRESTRIVNNYLYRDCLAQLFLRCGVVVMVSGDFRFGDIFTFTCGSRFALGFGTLAFDGSRLTLRVRSSVAHVYQTQHTMNLMVCTGYN